MATISRGHGRRPGITLLELLIVMGLGVICLGLLVGCVQNIRINDNTHTCRNNLKQIGLAIHTFVDDFGRIPPLYGGSDGESVGNSQHSPDIWGSTHVFLLPYIEQGDLYQSMANGKPAVYDPTAARPDPNAKGPANKEVIFTYMCPSDPSMSDEMLAGGTSYAANAQVFAPLADETLAGGAMYPSNKPNFTDRGSPLRDIKDGLSNTIFFTHSYAVCGNGTGTTWGYGAGVNQRPSPIDAYQPWSRASYLSQTYITPSKGAPFQVRPTTCNISDAATPHDAMTVLIGDGSVRSVVASIAPDTWNKACLPNDGSKMPSDWVD